MRSAPPLTPATFIVGALLLAGHAAAPAQAREGKYTSPLGNFSVPVPGGAGQRVQDEHDKNGGSVSFHDDFGNLKSIVYVRLSPATLAIQDSPEKLRALLKSFLDEFAMPGLIRPASADATVLYREHVQLEAGNAYFAIVDMPGGSTMYDARAKQGYDTKRGMLIFVRGDFVYMLSSGENPKVFDLGQPAKPLEALVEQEKKNLIAFASAITFE